MDGETHELQHPDFIWTWKVSSQGNRESIWLPYLAEVAKKPRSSLWTLRYNGGEIETDLRKIDFIMLYGASGNIPIEFLDALNTHRICLTIHRRNISKPYIFIPASGAGSDDLLSAQIIARSNERKTSYVARTLIRERFLATSCLSPISSTNFKRLASARNVVEVRNIEAVQATQYWAAFFQAIGLSSGMVRRNFPHPVNSALDAGSFFLHGILLRWILFHKLSPFHGFLHRPTNYPSLVYDLVEPYRHWIEVSVTKACADVGHENTQTLTAVTIEHLKRCLEEPVYVPSTRQTARRKSLLHGSVLALRAWLLNKQPRFVLPVEGEKRGGRPPKVGFSLPGYRVT